jgi:hypothetical protein
MESFFSGFCFWHKADIGERDRHVRFWGQSGFEMDDAAKNVLKGSGIDLEKRNAAASGTARTWDIGDRSLWPYCLRACRCRLSQPA